MDGLEGNQALPLCQVEDLARLLCRVCDGLFDESMLAGVEGADSPLEMEGIRELTGAISRR